MLVANVALAPVASEPIGAFVTLPLAAFDDAFSHQHLGNDNLCIFFSKFLALDRGFYAFVVLQSHINVVQGIATRDVVKFAFVLPSMAVDYTKMLVDNTNHDLCNLIDHIVFNRSRLGLVMAGQIKAS